MGIGRQGTVAVALLLGAAGSAHAGSLVRSGAAFAVGPADAASGQMALR